MANHNEQQQQQCPPPPSSSPNARPQRNDRAKDASGLLNAAEDDDTPSGCSGYSPHPSFTTQRTPRTPLATLASATASASSTTTSTTSSLVVVEKAQQPHNSSSVNDAASASASIINHDGTIATATAAPAGSGPTALLQPHTLSVAHVLAHFYPSHATNATTTTSTTTTTTTSTTTGADGGAGDATLLPGGLTSHEAADRLQQYGPNQVAQATRVSGWSILLRQVANALTLVLVAAMALSFGVRDWVEGAVVTAVILLNVFLGWIQEWKAERTIASLRHLSSPTARVVRDGGIEAQIPSEQLVPGDLVVFATGDVLPADVRLLKASNLEVDEASLTGESLPVAKITHALDATGAPVRGSNGHDGGGGGDKELGTATATTAAPLGAGDQINMGFASTTVTKGRGVGIVVATGMLTQLGQIAAAMQASTSVDDAADDGSKCKPKPSLASRAKRRLARTWHGFAAFLGLRHGTPLQIRLNKFAYLLLGLAVVCAIIVFAVAEFDITNEVILYAIALGIGVIPESLVAVLTITFSAGAKRMAESNVVVRKLAALESLGSVTDVFSDKTGTLTTSRMVTSQIAFLLPSPRGSGGVENEKRVYAVERAATPYEPVGRLYPVEDESAFVDAAALPEHIGALTTAAALCNVATVTFHPHTHQYTATGDPTEIALQVFAMKLRIHKPALTASSYTFTQEFPFDSTIKRATFVYRDVASAAGAGAAGQHVLFTKGAVEGVLERCQYIFAGTDCVQLSETHRAAILDLMERMARDGLRVLAFAHRRLPSHGSSVLLEKAAEACTLARDDAEDQLTFLGLAGLYDPPRPETPGAIAACHQAGIVARMLTGDHVLTARAIAREIGILQGHEGASAVMTASQFDALTDAEIDALPDLPLVVARCSPTTKVRMVAAGRRRGLHLAMTGDGVNDSPALKQAPVGIALGITGTQIAKDSSELILTDDKFNSIVKGIEEGRTVFDNIQRFCIALLVANVGEVILLLVGLAFRDAHDDSVFPLSPISILFVNMVTASLPAVGLGLERGGKDVMTRPPHDLNAGVFSRNVISDMLFYGFTMGSTCLLAFILMIYAVGAGVLALDCNESFAAGCETVFQARAAVFVALILQNLFIAWELLSMDQSFFAISPCSRLKRNPMLFWSVIFGICTIPICLYVPRFNTDVFRHSPLSGIGWAVALGMTVLFIVCVEAWKALARRGHWPWLAAHTGGAVTRTRVGAQA